MFAAPFCCASVCTLVRCKGRKGDCYWLGVGGQGRHRPLHRDFNSSKFLHNWICCGTTYTDVNSPFERSSEQFTFLCTSFSRSPHQVALLMGYVDQTKGKAILQSKYFPSEKLDTCVILIWHSCIREGPRLTVKCSAMTNSPILNFWKVEKKKKLLWLVSGWGWVGKQSTWDDLHSQLKPKSLNVN